MINAGALQNLSHNESEIRSAFMPQTRNLASQKMIFCGKWLNRLERGGLVPAHCGESDTGGKSVLPPMKNWRAFE